MVHSFGFQFAVLYFWFLPSIFIIVFTRADQREALQHVLRNVLVLADTDPIPSSFVLHGISTITDLINFPREDIPSLTYQSEDVFLPLHRGNVGLLMAFQAFFIESTKHSPFTSLQQFLDMTQDDFDTFRISPSYYAPLLGHTSTSPPNMSSTTTPRNPVLDFKRGMKRDISHFRPLKNDSQFDSWYRHTLSQARAQGVEEVLDPSYQPSSHTEQALFTEKQKYMFAVFESTLFTDKGKALVRKYYDSFDAQKCFHALQTYALSSTRAAIDSSALLSYITSVRYGDGSWRGSSHAFILHWQEQVRKYETLVQPIDHFSGGQKRTMLENVVHPLAELRAIKIQADHHRVQSGQSLTYDQYSDLLLSAATSYDAQFLSKSANRSSARKVYQHDLDTHPVEEANNECFDIDSDPIVLQAHVSSQRQSFPTPSSSRLPRNIWNQLSIDDRKLWDKLSLRSKSLLSKHSSLSPSSNSGNLLQNISAHEFLTFLDSSISDNSSSPASSTIPSTQSEPTTASSSGTSESLLAHVTKRTSLPPGDIRRVLSTFGKLSADVTSATSLQSDIPASSGASLPSAPTSINMANLTYAVAVHRNVRVGALIDRGANGGIAGDDLRLINRTGRQVDIQGIDNHQLVDIPIVTAGAVLNTQRGPVIGIFHQYAYTGKGRSIHSSSQLEHFLNDVNDRSRKVKGGLQRITTVDGYIIPMRIHSGLPYIDMRPYTDDEWESLPHVVLTSDMDWNPSIMDNDIIDDSQYDDESHPFQAFQDSLFDEFGDYRLRDVSHSSVYPHDLLSCDPPPIDDGCVYLMMISLLLANSISLSRNSLTMKLCSRSFYGSPLMSSNEPFRRQLNLLVCLIVQF